MWFLHWVIIPLIFFGIGYFIGRDPDDARKIGEKARDAITELYNKVTRKESKS